MKVDFFKNYAIVAMQSDNIIFCACKMIKGTSGFNLKKTIFFRQMAPTSKKQLKYFSNINNSTILTPPGPQGCLEKLDYPLSSNLVVWCSKIGQKPRKLEKCQKIMVFFDTSSKFLGFEPNQN